MILAKKALDFLGVEFEIFEAIPCEPSDFLLKVIRSSLEDYIANIGFTADNLMVNPPALTIARAHIEYRDVISVRDEVIV